MTEVPHVYCIMVGGTGSTVGDGMRRFHVGGWSGEPAIDISERNRGMCVRERLDQARRPEGKQAIMASFRELGTMPENVGNERYKE